MSDERDGRVRDFIGYGRNPPDPRWPAGAHLAINFVNNYEEGGEFAVPDGDAASETALTEGSSAPVKGRDLAAESMFQFGSRVGFWRLHRIFSKRGLPCTVFGIARALERNPEVCAAIRESGWDVAGHGLRWEMHPALDEATERAHISEAADIIERCVGHRPEGWYCRYGPSINTRRILVELGFSYDSDSYDDELPYWVKVNGKPQLILPYSITHNDVRFPRQGMSSGDEYFAYIRNAIECALHEDPPGILSFGLHNRIIGHAGRAAGLAKLLDWIGTQKKIWVARRTDIAAHWRKEHPPK